MHLLFFVFRIQEVSSVLFAVVRDELCVHVAIAFLQGHRAAFAGCTDYRDGFSRSVFCQAELVFL